MQLGRITSCASAVTDIMLRNSAERVCLRIHAACFLWLGSFVRGLIVFPVLVCGLPLISVIRWFCSRERCVWILVSTGQQPRLITTRSMKRRAQHGRTRERNQFSSRLGQREIDLQAARQTHSTYRDLLVGQHYPQDSEEQDKQRKSFGKGKYWRYRAVK